MFRKNGDKWKTTIKCVEQHFSIIYLNEHSRLVVRISGKYLCLLGGNGGVSFDKDSHHSSSSLNSQGQGRDIQQEQVLNIFGLISGQNSRLDSCVKIAKFEFKAKLMNDLSNSVRWHELKYKSSVKTRSDAYLTLTCTIGHSLIGVDALVQITAIEEILQQLLNLGDAC